jgi:hypothetical protein
MKTRAVLTLLWLLLSGAPAVAATKGVDGRPRPVTPVALLGWCAALIALAGAALAASSHAARSPQERAERARVAKLLASLEEAQRARLAERERNGLRRRRPPAEAPRGAGPSRFDGGFSFLARERTHEPPRPTLPPARLPAAAPSLDAEAAPDPAATRASEQLSLLLEAIVSAERRLAEVRAELKQADADAHAARTLDVGSLAAELSSEVLTRLQTLGAVATQGGSTPTLNLGPLDLPGNCTLDLGKLDVPDDVLDRLRALAEATVTDGTVDLGPLELPGAGTLVLPRDLLTRGSGCSPARAG